MDFHLQFPIPPFEHKIAYPQQLLFVGSCFAENIGAELQRLKFTTCINPHGILYNPSALATALKSYINDETVKEEELFFSNDRWNSWAHHSRFSNPDKEECLQQINAQISDAHDVLKNAEWLFITFGSAFVYRHMETGKIVGNCHKAPQKEFIKSLPASADIVTEYNALIQTLKTFNPKLRVVFTVSPVRYIRDGVVENNLSKAILLQAVHELAKQHDHIFYFPAYELVIDDLRDYRFYKADLVHPNEQAITYVFEKLRECCFSDETKLLAERIRELITAGEHRPQHAGTAAFHKFKASALRRTKELQQQFPFIDLSNEIKYFSDL